MKPRVYRPVRVQTGFEDLTGKIFGPFRVIRLLGVWGTGDIHWECECLTCGVRMPQNPTYLTSTTTKCPECAKCPVPTSRLSQRNRKSRARAYACWKSFCRKPDFCEAWKNDFPKFFVDMGAKPKGLSLLRHDPTLPYSKENCNWGMRTTVNGPTLGRPKTHGMTGTPVYGCWNALRRKPDFCDAWRNDFSAFFSDMGDKPKGLSMLRRDPTMPYSKDNCYWGKRARGSHSTSSPRETHGKSRGRVYGCWNALRRKPDFCDVWKNDFSAFYADMGDRPPSAFLFRRDKTKPFSKANCYWGKSTFDGVRSTSKRHDSEAKSSAGAEVFGPSTRNG